MSDEPVSKKAKLDKRRRSFDRIVLNVGGTKISTSKVTLSSSSFYFSRQFSDEWNDTSGEDDEEDFFLDQDPDDFKILLSFMRFGKIEAKKLTRCVLMLADFLAMERLLEAVRVTAKRMAFHGDRVLLETAIQAGIMTKSEATFRKEFATLRILDPVQMSLTNQQNVRLVNTLAVAEITSSGKNFQTCKTTFIDGLNTLSRRGYRKFEEEVSKVDRTTEPNSTLLQFSRIKGYKRMSELDDIILVDDPHCDLGEGKIFALQIEISEGNAMKPYIEAFPQLREKITLTIDGYRYDVKTRTSWILQIEGSKAMAWLHNEGYEQRESKLESWYLSAHPPEYHNLISSLRLWSRPLRKGDCKAQTECT